MNKLFSNIKGDAFGGITAGIVALPLALAFGVSSGLGPTAGLYGAIFLAFFAALFGGTNTQISGPTAPMTAVSMVVISSLIVVNNGDLTAALPSILMVFLLAGLIQIGMGLTGVGQYIKYIPYPVVSGFMTAIGVIILITQILPFLGYYPKEDKAFVNKFRPQAEQVLLQKIIKDEANEGLLVLNDFKETISRSKQFEQHDILKEAQNLAAGATAGVMGSLKTLPRALQYLDWLAIALASATIIIIYGFKRITTAIPSTLMALIVVSGFAYFMKLNYRSIDQIPSGFPEIHFEIFTGFSLANITPYLASAVTLALLGAIDSLLTSVVADNITKTRHNPNKELLGQGIGNSIASLFGGLPGAGATIRTVVNINSGGKTRLSGMIAAILLLFILLALGPIASKIPAAVLAGILITVGIGVMDYKGLRAIKNVPKTEVFIMIVVLLLSVFWNLVYAVGIGLVLAALVFMKKMADFTVEQSKVIPLNHELEWEDEDSFPKQLKEEVYIGRIAGPLFFGSTSEIQKLTASIPESASHIIIRMDRVPYIDQSGLYALEDLIIELRQGGSEVLLVGLQMQPKNLMGRINIIPDLIGENHLFENFKEATEHIRKTVKNVI